MVVMVSNDFGVHVLKNGFYALYVAVYSPNYG
jgi:hypothetical protein